MNKADPKAKLFAIDNSSFYHSLLAIINTTMQARKALKSLRFSLVMFPSRIPLCYIVSYNFMSLVRENARERLSDNTL